MRGHEPHAPAHFDAEVLSALGRLQRCGHMTASQTRRRLDTLATAPFERHLPTPLLAGARERRRNLRLVDALYVELARRLGWVIVTTDSGLPASTPTAELLIVAG
jgi:predicted nucleic acid-binding protein